MTREGVLEEMSRFCGGVVEIQRVQGGNELVFWKWLQKSKIELELWNKVQLTYLMADRGNGKERNAFG